MLKLKVRPELLHCVIMQLIDCLAHLDFNRFDDDRNGVLQRADMAGVTDIIIPAIAKSNWAEISAVCDTYNDMPVSLHAAYGLHPMFTDEHQSFHLDDLKTCLIENNAVAIGECGLDYYMDNPDEEAQIHYFQAQIDIASEMDLPLIIHARKSLDKVLHMLKSYQGRVRGMVHSFSGSLQQALQFIDVGFYLSFGGPFTYSGANRLRRLIPQLPLDAVLLETDAPDQPDSRHKGLRNESAYLIEVAQAMAMLRDLDIEIVAKQTSSNARRLFRLDD